MHLHETSCCSLCHLSADNGTSVHELRALIDFKREQAERQVWYKSKKAGGQRAMFCITTPEEEALAAKLQTLNFAPIQTFGRRKGYPPGDLTMWFLRW